MRSQPNSILAVKSSACGEDGSLKNVSKVWMSDPARGGPGLFPPDLVVQVKALACELPATRNLPLARWSIADLSRQVRQSGLVATISDSTIWRWLHEDAIRPGDIGRGSFLVIPSLPAKQDESWTSMKESGMVASSRMMNSSSLQMRKPVSKHAVAAIPLTR
jgi:hypothetical protein